MSGITPLLDTLLHQVLGKRVDVPAARELNEPVRPMVPSEASRAVHSDSRLDTRPPLPILPETILSETRARLSPEASRSPAPAPQLLSSSTHFSPAARTIADVLVKFPAPPSIIRPLQPLFMASELTEPGTLSAPQLATRLEGSIKDSGLFYEAHLARWFRGELSRTQLEREPQMDKSLAPHLLDEGLQTLVRHQLELLVAPVLRWEGDIWSGVLMALVIQLPEALEQRGRHGANQGEPEEQAQEEAQEQQAWRTELTLRHGTFGDIRAHVCLQGVRLDLTLNVEAEQMVARLETGVERLRPRLAACGFNEVGIQIRRVPAGDKTDE